MIYDLKLVNSVDCEDSLHDFKLEDPNLIVEFDPFVMPHTGYTIFSDDLGTSSFLKGIIETSSRK